MLLRHIGAPSTRQSGRMVVYGLIPVALAQLCYFSSVQYLSIGVALLLEYLAPVCSSAGTGHQPAPSGDEGFPREPDWVWPDWCWFST